MIHPHLDTMDRDHTSTPSSRLWRAGESHPPISIGTKIALLLSLSLPCAPLDVAAQEWEWVSVVSGNESYGGGVAVSSDNDVVWSGTLMGNENFAIGGRTYKSLSHRIFVAKSKPDGEVAWVLTPTGGTSNGFGSYAQESGNSIVDFNAASAPTPFVLGRFSAPEPATFDYFVKVDPDGNSLWGVPWRDMSGESYARLATDKSGNTFGHGVIHLGNRTGLWRVASDGSLKWITECGGIWQGVSADGRGHVYGVGRMLTTTASFPGETLHATNGLNFLAKFSVEDGSMVWVRQFGGDVASGVQGFVANESGIYVAGTTTSILFPEVGVNPLGLFLAKIDIDGNPVWIRGADAGGINWDISDLEFSPSGRLVVAVRNIDSYGDLRFGGAKFQDGYSRTVLVVAQFDATGNWICGTEAHSRDDGFLGGVRLAVDSESNVYVCGAFGRDNQPTEFGGLHFRATYRDAFLAKIREMPEAYVLVDGQVVKGGAAIRGGAASALFKTKFPNGSVFYTLDGTEPSFLSTEFKDPLVLTNSGVLRGIAYSADFSRSAAIGPVQLTVEPVFPVSVRSGGGGWVALNPEGIEHRSNAVVRAIATSAPGWTFLRWEGDLAGGGAETSFQVLGPRSATAVFGTSLSTTEAGKGDVVVRPASALHPIRSTVRLSAIPEPGHFFARWGNAGSGTLSPLDFVIDAPTQTVAALFAPLGADQVALTLLTSGRGSVVVTPGRNVFSIGEEVQLVAVPAEGAAFQGWAGDPSVPENGGTVVLRMNSSRTVVARFSGSGPPRLAVRLDPNPNALNLRAEADFMAPVALEASTDLVTWREVNRGSSPSGLVLFEVPVAPADTGRFFRITST